MPFVAPLIATAIGVGTIGEMAIGLGLSLALGAASRALAPTPSTASASGQRLSLRTEANGAREWVVGRAATAGTLIYHQVYGPNGNDNLQLVLQLADHECDALEKVFVDGVEKAWNSGTGAVTDYPGMKITWHAGTWSQAADDDLVANGGGRWTVNDRGRGICYVVITIPYDQKLYPTGLPKFLFVVRGAKLYDIRKDSTAGGSGSHRWATPSTWEWSENPSVIAYNYARGLWTNGQRIIGMNCPASALPAAEWIAAANVCDESVTLAAGGTEKRYVAGGVLTSAVSHREILADITRACAGLFIETGGALKLRPGAARTAVATVTDDDLLDDAEIEINAKRPRSQLINAVFGSFHDPSVQYEMVALPPRLSPADEAIDGVRLEEHYALDLVTSGSQGQRILEIMRRRGRMQRTVKCRLPAKFALLEAGDWITWNSARYGWSATFEIRTANVGFDKQLVVELQEMAASVYGWGTGDELDPVVGGTLPSGAPTFTTIAGLAVAATSIAGGTSEVRPGLTVTWTPVADLTVTAVEIEYRRSGDTVALSVRSEEPNAGTYTFVSGVQGSTSYQVRARPVTVPVRAVNWTSWVSTSSATAAQVVSVSSSMTTVVVPDDSVGPPKLTPQARKELELVTAVADVQGSVAEQVAAALGWVQQTADALLHAQVDLRALGTAVEVETRIRTSETESLAQQITSVTSLLDQTSALVRSEITARSTDDLALAQQITVLTASLGTANAAITTEATARATADSAMASTISTLSSTVGGHTTSISSLTSTVGGYAAQWVTSINSDGYPIGFVTLSGSASVSTFGVLADNFYVAQPGVTGGTPVQIFTIGSRGGTPKIAIDGDLLIDGSVTAQHLDVITLDAISADIGTLQAGKLLSSTGKTLIDLDNDRLRFIA